MQAVRRAAAAVTLLAAALVCAAVQAAQAGGGSGGGGSGGGGGQCTVNLGGQWVTVQCGYGGGTGGGGTGGSGGGGTTLTTTCIFTPLNEVSAKQLGLAWPPPKGMSWALMDCPGGGPGAGPQAILMNNGTGAPQITPQQLLQQALSELRIPALQPGTAPPRGKDGLVGLPEWFWVPAAEWHRLSVTVRAGPVWATATATPAGLSFQPGGGLGAVSCAGPGTAYNAARPASQQHTRCSFTYDQSSAGQPGHVYQAAVVLSWRIAWVGSGGAGGLVDAGLPVPFAFPLPVAQGEALVSSR